MRQYARKLIAVLLAVLSLAIAASVACSFAVAASTYTLSLVVVKFYCLLWFVAVVLSIYAGLITASTMALFATALGFVAFAAVCMLSSDFCARLPQVVCVIEFAAPVLFILAWLAIVIAAFRHSRPAIRRSAWLWLTIALTLLLTFPAYNVGRAKLCALRNQHLRAAADTTLRIADQLAAYQRTNGAYPDTLEQAGIDPALTRLPYRDQTIKYFGSRFMCILTFEDPLHAGSAVYSWDTSKNGWYPADPYEAAGLVTHNLFLGVLCPK
jgi:hypothetical protein